MIICLAASLIIAAYFTVACVFMVINGERWCWVLYCGAMAVLSWFAFGMEVGTIWFS